MLGLVQVNGGDEGAGWRRAAKLTAERRAMVEGGAKRPATTAAGAGAGAAGAATAGDGTTAAVEWTGGTHRTEQRAVGSYFQRPNCEG